MGTILKFPKSHKNMPKETEPKKDQKLVAKESDIESGQKKQTVNPQYTFETGDHTKAV